MEPKTKQEPEAVVREIRRQTRRKFSSDDKIRIILEGLKGEESIAAIARREGSERARYEYLLQAIFLKSVRPC